MRPLGRVVLPLSLVALFFAADAPHRRAAPAPSASWLATVEAEIAHSEYFIRGDKPQAPNRAQDLRTYFEAGGVRVVPRVPADPSWTWQLSLVRYGRESALRTPARATRGAHANRMEYRRGDLIEWYVNDERGLEQGFTLLRAPQGEGRLAFDLAVGGSLRAQRSAQGDQISLVDAQALPVLCYGSLRAADARGRVLASRFAPASPRNIRIEVDAEGAAYPITVDPLATSPIWHVEGDFANAGRGLCVATAGDVNGDGFSDLLVAASRFDVGAANQGLVTLFYGTANGQPSATPAWSAQGDSSSIAFGQHVATAGDVNGDGYSDILIGDNEQTVGGVGDVGAVYAWYGSASGLGKNGLPSNADWVATGVAHDDFFGQGLACAGDVNGDGYSDVVLSTPLKSISGGANNGEVRIYFGSHSGLTNPAFRTINGANDSRFGAAVATAGDVNADGFSDVIIGAPGGTNTAALEGLAYVYYGPDFADAKRTLLAWGSPSANFGAAVATAGDIDGDGYADVIVGSPGFDSLAAGNDNGSVQVYRGSAAGIISNQVAWRSVGTQLGGQLGYSVSTAGDVNADGYADVIAGWPFYTNGQSHEGAALGWFGSANGLGPIGTTGFEDWKVESNNVGAQLGWSVSIAGDVNADGKSDVIVGAPGYTNGQAGEGAAFLYLGTALRLATTPEWQLPSGAAGAQLGGSVAFGDFNGDGYSDLVIAAPSYSGTNGLEGTVWVFYGGPNGPGDSPDWYVFGDQYKGQVGSSVADAGDVNGDGYDDLLVGAQGYSSTSSLAQGRAYVFLGGPTGLPNAPLATLADAAWHAETSQNSANLGSSVSSAGDVNGDGYADILVGAVSYTNGQSQEGAAFLWLGSASGLGPNGDPATNADWTAETNQPSSQFGGSLACAGDVNRDGYSDIIIGAASYDSTYINGGGAFVWYGSASGLGANGTPANADRWFTGVETGQLLGTSVGSAGDMNNDGYSEIIIGSPYRGTQDTGWADIYRGGPGGISTLFLGIGSGIKDSHLGTRVGPAGDVNGDGFADAFVTAPNLVNGETNEGGFDIVYGAVSSPLTVTTESNLVDGQLRTAAGAGDVNGDGYADLLVGLPFSNSSAGLTWLYYGGGGKGARDVHARARRVLSSVGIPHLGLSDHDREYLIVHQAWSPFGRGRMRPEYESKPLGTLMSGSGLSLPMPGYIDMARGDPTQDARGDIQNSDPTANVTYHWRMRFHYDISQQPFQPFSRWFSPPGDGPNETDLRMNPAIVTGAEPVVAIGVRLEAGTPNPFLHTTTLRYSLPYAMPVRIAIYDARGRLVRELLHATSEAAGWHSVTWNGADANGRTEVSGAYFARLETAEGREMQRVVLSR